MRYVFSVVFFVTTALRAQVTAPVLGLIPDHGSLRTMYGIPAAGTVGAALIDIANFRLVEVAPSQSFALAVSEDGKVWAIRIATSESLPTRVELSGLSANPSKIVFSPDGTSAALWQAEKGVIEVISGLPGSVTLRSIAAGSWGGAPLAFAVSDDGRSVVAAWPSGVFAFTAGSDTRLLPTEGIPWAVAFFHGRPDLAIMTNLQVITLAQSPDLSAPTEWWRKPSDLPTDTPVQIATGLAVSADNRKLTITGDWGGVYTIDFESKAATYATCDCTTTGLASMGSTLYRISSLEKGSLKLYDAETGQVTFVATQGDQQ